MIQREHLSTCCRTLIIALSSNTIQTIRTPLHLAGLLRTPHVTGEVLKTPGHHDAGHASVSITGEEETSTVSAQLLSARENSTVSAQLELRGLHHGTDVQGPLMVVLKTFMAQCAGKSRCALVVLRVPSQRRRAPDFERATSQS